MYYRHIHALGFATNFLIICEIYKHFAGNLVIERENVLRSEGIYLFNCYSTNKYNLKCCFPNDMPSNDTIRNVYHPTDDGTK